VSVEQRPVAQVLADHRICNARYGEVTCYCNPLPWMTLDEYGGHIEALAASEQEPCPTCSWPSRETVGMVCQTCGTDYGAPEPDATP